MKILAFLLLAAFVPSCAAQATGSLRITVTDVAGAAIPAAHIHVIETDGYPSTDSRGTVVVRGLRAGNYTIVFSRPGFKNKTASSVTIVAGGEKQLDVTLEQGSPSFSDIRTYPTLKPNTYAEFLRAVKEPPLCRKPLPTHAESYRFIWIPTFLHPVFMRVDIQQDGTAVLRVETLSGKGGYDWGKVQTNTSRKLEPSEEETLFTTLADMGFWDLPARVEFEDPYSVTVDGTAWVIEGVRNGACHAVSRYSSPLTDIFSKYFLGEVAQLRPYYKNSQ